MNEECKPILGYWLGGRLFFSDQEKRIIIEDYLSGDESKKSVYKRYTGYSHEHGKISKWMRELGIDDKHPKMPNFVGMENRKKTQKLTDKDFELEKLKNRISELEDKLRSSEMKAIAFSTMVDVAEKEFNIPIRKKLNTKP